MAIAQRFALHVNKINHLISSTKETRQPRFKARDIKIRRPISPKSTCVY